MSSRDDSQHLFDECQIELRTPENHINQCQSLTGHNCHANSVEYCINRTSVLEEVPGFSVVNGLPHDIMRDLFERVMHYELKLFLLFPKAFLRLIYLITGSVGTTLHTKTNLLLWTHHHLNI